MTAYQLAIAMENENPGLAAAMGYVIGGSGGGRNSLAWYAAGELSKRIARGEPIANDVEGAFLTNESVAELRYQGPSGPIVSSLTGSGYDLSMFRRRGQAHV